VSAGPVGGSERGFLATAPSSRPAEARPVCLGSGRRTEMTESLTSLREARGQLDAIRSAMADPLKRWASEPHRRELVPEVVAALSELIGREAVYQRLLEQVVQELGERVAGFSEGRETMTRAEQIQSDQETIGAWDWSLLAATVAEEGRFHLGTLSELIHSGGKMGIPGAPQRRWEEEHCFREAVKAVTAGHGLVLKIKRNRDLWVEPMAGAP
jgi:hypothetical protein